ncbi:MAG TPA: polysaccharide deacetylase family protein [Solirubrobacteraceae bacterium]
MRSRAIPVLLYHAVPDTPSVNDPLSVPFEQFAGHVDAIVRSGRAPVSIAEIAAGLRGERPLPEHAVAVTFDDAYEDTPRAIERLRERGLRSSVYVTTGQIDSGPMIRREQLVQLAREPETVELGAHTVNHPPLDELGIEEIEREVSDSKQALEQTIGRSVDTFAYPFGAYDARVRRAVIDAGFNSAAAVKNAFSHPEDDPWAIARVTVRAATSAERIAQILDGRGAPFAWQDERLRTRGYRTVRKLRRRTGLGGGAWR